MSKRKPVENLQPELPYMAAVPARKLASKPATEPARAPRKLEVWFDLLDRLAERKGRHDVDEATKANLPPTRAQLLLDRAVWNIILFARWLRPRLNRRARAARTATQVKLHQSTVIMAQQSKLARNHVYGWLLWQIRLLRTDPDRKLAALGLLGGFAVPMLMIVALSHFAPKPIEPLLQPYIDPSVPVPSAEFIETEEDTASEAPIETPNDSAAQATIEATPGVSAAPATVTITPPPVPLTSNTFRFEAFAQRAPNGNLHLLSHGAETEILKLFPIGTPAVNVMRFFGEVMMNSGSELTEASLAAKSRCMSMPINKLFTVKTVTCTYGHALPLPRPATESPRSRVFWILALSYDRAGKLLDLRIHARTTMASQ